MARQHGNPIKKRRKQSLDDRGKGGVNLSRSIGSRQPGFPSTAPVVCATLGTRIERSKSRATVQRLNPASDSAWCRCSTILCHLPRAVTLQGRSHSRSQGGLSAAMDAATIGFKSWFGRRAVASSAYDEWNPTQRIRNSGDDIGTRNMKSIDRNTVAMNQEHSI